MHPTTLSMGSNNLALGKNQDLTPSQNTSKTDDTANNSHQQPVSKAEKSQELDLQEQQQLTKLQQRDREVKAHEAAHLAAAGTLALGGANFSYQKGPDGQRYAIGGDVSIDISKVPGDPQATLAKSEQIRRAALAPAQPSSTDVSVAARASQMAAEARMEIIQERFNPQNGEEKSDAISQYQETVNAENTDSSSTLNLYA